MSGLGGHVTWIDLLVLVWTLLLLLFLGLAAGKRTSATPRGFLLADRGLPWWLLGISMASSGFALGQPLLAAELVGGSGLGGYWILWSLLLGSTLTAYLFAGPWRRSELLTDVEFAALRYGGAPGALLRGLKGIWFSLFFSALVLAWLLEAMTMILRITLGLSREWELVILGLLCGLALVYSLASGLLGVVVTDFVQLSLTLAGSLALALLACREAAENEGGLTAKLREAFGREEAERMLSFFPGDAGTWFGLGGGALLFLLCAQWWNSFLPGSEPGGGGFVAQRLLAARSPKDARRGTLLFGILQFLIRPWPWILVALWAAAEYRLEGPSLREGYPGAMVDLLPPGLLGLVLAGLFAAFMSTVDTQLHLAGSYLVNDVYRPFLARRVGELHCLGAGRVAMVLVLGASGFAAYRIEGLRSLFEVLLVLGAGSGLVLLLRWYWWRINAFSEIVALLAPPLLALLLDPGFRDLTGLSNRIPLLLEIHDRGLLLFLVLGGTTLLWLLATFLTPAVSPERLEVFFRRVRPSGAWGPVARRCPALRPAGRLDQSLLSWALASAALFSLLFATGEFLLGTGSRRGVLLLFAVLAGTLLWGNGSEE